MSNPDLVVIGAGLAGGLLAWRLAEARPELRVLVLEAGEAPGGNHTWSFHEGDLDAAGHALVAPLVVASWPRYEVRFPERRRTLRSGYRSISSDRFAALLRDRLGEKLRVGAAVAELGLTHVVTANGERIEAGAVIDARGPRAMPALDLGFQKFLGQELEFERPHGLAHPIVMDATVAQEDGYRFVYCLPFSSTRMLVEDTYYSDGSGLDREALSRRIKHYAAAAGWGPFRTVREEEGVLPIALGGDIDAHLRSLNGVPTIGVAAALFHPTTGYSFPDAVRTATLVAELPDLAALPLAAVLEDHIRRTWQGRAYFRGLNRMLFCASPPAERYRVLQHFHRLPDDLVSRFYAGRPSPLDKARILFGKPPVPVGRALAALAQGRR